MHRLAAAGLVGASVVSCASAPGDEVAVRAADAARWDEASTVDAGGSGAVPPADATDAVDATPDPGVIDGGGRVDDGPIEADRGGIDRDAVGDESAPPPSSVWENSLGMRFVPVAGTSVMFSIWETRVQDYEAYAQATGAMFPKPDFPETALQPKAAVSRAQAEAFAAWLTDKERKGGVLGSAHKYRLPMDQEWDVAMEVGATGGPYPWGAIFPPPDRFANYGITDDGFMYTSPVGTFAPNRFGLYDMAGNLWEWIGEACASGGAYLVRGCGWNAAHEPYFVSTFHYCFAADLVGHHNVGFRTVLEGGRPATR
jgi:formylglycine-generating enzyme required for sulfatase activity